MPSSTVQSVRAVASTTLLMLIVLVTVTASVTATDDCHQADSPLLCHGVRMVRSVANMKPMRLVDGVEIVRIPSTERPASERSRSTGNGYADRVVQYLESHEIKISVQELMKGSGLVDVFGRALREVESENEVVGMCGQKVVGNVARDLNGKFR